MRHIQYRYCEHMDYGVGSAQLVTYRKKERDDLFMVTFQMTGQKEKWFFSRKDFAIGLDIEFIDEARATRLYKKGRDKPINKKVKAPNKRSTNLQELLDGLG